MGGKQGVIWNDSNFTIEYIAYGAYESIAKETIEAKISPNFTAKAGNVSITGFTKDTTTDKYTKPFVEVLPGCIGTVGLNNIKL